MRHLGSLLAAVVIAPAVWLLLAIGQQETNERITTWLDNGEFDTAELLGPAAYLAAAAILLGLIATLRISPLGPLVAGVAYVGVFVAVFINPIRVIDAIPESVNLRWVDAPAQVPVTNGTLAVLGVCLLVTAFSAKRWHRWPAQVPAGASAASETAGEAPVAPDAVPAAAETAEPAEAASVAPDGAPISVAKPGSVAKPAGSVAKPAGSPTVDAESTGAVVAGKAAGRKPAPKANPGKQPPEAAPAAVAAGAPADGPADGPTGTAGGEPATRTPGAPASPWSAPPGSSPR